MKTNALFRIFVTQSPDTNFDELIKSIYGDIEELEKLEELEIEKLNKKNMNNAYAESRKRGMLHQAEQRVSDLFDSYYYLVQMSIYSNVTSCISPSLAV